MKAPVHQLLAAASPGDAVTGQAFAWARLLEEWGHRGDIVAEHVDPRLSGRVRRLAEVGGLGEGPLILHFSIWSAVVTAALRSSGPLAVCYHNVTPAELLRPYNPGLADDCDRARAELPRLAERATAMIADSTFNARELTRAGSPDATVVPLLIDTRLRAGVGRGADTPSVISVGRIVPNKRIEDVIRAFTLYQRELRPAATLTLVGGAGGFERYRAGLERLAERLGTSGVRFAGWVSDAERDAAYGTADAYLCMSEHEGFCAPLIEAMTHGVPIVARDAGAVRETVGRAGLVIDHDVALAAEALREVVSRPEIRRGLAAASARRLEELRPDTLAARLRIALSPILEPG